VGVNKIVTANLWLDSQKMMYMNIKYQTQLFII